MELRKGSLGRRIKMTMEPWKRSLGRRVKSKVGWAAPAWGQLADPSERIRLQPVTHWVQPAQHPGRARRDRTSSGLDATAVTIYATGNPQKSR